VFGTAAVARDRFGVLVLALKVQRLATRAWFVVRSNSLNASAGVSHSRVLRGRVFKASATVVGDN